MYRLIRRINLIRTPLSLGLFSQTPLKSLRFVSSSSNIVSYPQSASLASSFVDSENNENPVIVFFENHGFSESQISVIVKLLPRVLSAKHEKTLLPKLLFFQSKGLSSPEVAKLISANPYLLYRSLNRHIIPTFDYFQGLLQTEADTILAIKRYSSILLLDLQRDVRPKIDTLRQIGVSHTNIAAILRGQPRIFSSNSIRFKEIVVEVKGMGFNPLHSTFVLAVSALIQMSKSTWKKKFEVYRKWGCSEEEVLSAFGRHPVCMLASEDKINGIMDYFVNTIGCESSFITRNPSLICYSLKRRIVPRGYVYLVLSSKGLIKKDVNRSWFSFTQKGFLDKFIKPHEKHIPGLLKLYEEKLEI